MCCYFFFLDFAMPPSLPLPPRPRFILLVSFCSRLAAPSPLSLRPSLPPCFLLQASAALLLPCPFGATGPVRTLPPPTALEELPRFWRSCPTCPPRFWKLAGAPTASSASSSSSSELQAITGELINNEAWRVFSPLEPQNDKYRDIGNCSIPTGPPLRSRVKRYRRDRGRDALVSV